MRSVLPICLFLVSAILAGAAVPVESPGPSSRRTPFAITEVMYHPLDRPDGLEGEFIEIYNSQPWGEDVSGFRLDGAVSFTFPSGTTIGANDVVVVAKTPSDLKKISAFEGLVLGPWEGSLANGGEQIQLLNSSGAELLVVAYEDAEPWPEAADGLGSSLVLARASYGEGDVRAWKASMHIGGSPGSPAALARDNSNVVINEVFRHRAEGAALGFIEILNRGDGSVDLSGWILTVAGEAAAFSFPEGSLIGANGRLVVAEAELPFDLRQPELLIGLQNAEGSSIVDAVRAGVNEEGLSTGRAPDGADRWRWLQSESRGAANGEKWRSPVVFNEIMFHPISDLDADEYVELFNRSESQIDVGNWKVTGGIDYTIPADTNLPAGGFLVIAKDAGHLRAIYPQLTEQNTVGNYSGRLSNRGETLALLRPASFELDGAVPDIRVDEVRYRDRTRYSQWADGGGSSLELRDPDSDNGKFSNWADSNEETKSKWTQIEVAGALVPVAGLSARSLQILHLGGGEMLIDDVEVFQGNGSSKVKNGAFEEDGDWAFQGNHVRSNYETHDGGRVLRAVASGRGDPHSNRIRQRMTGSLSASSDATIRARVRWQRGHPEILFRTLGNQIEALGRAEIPVNLGSPGSRNSAWVDNAPPTIEEVHHSPILPSANEPIIVTAWVDDPDGLSWVRLIYREDGSDDEATSVPMAPDSTGRYTATIDGALAGKTLAFSVEAEDLSPVPAKGRFPDGGHECLVRVGETQPRPMFGDYRIWFTDDTREAWVSSSRPKASNEPLDATFVYNGERVIYAMGATYSGSFFNSPNYNRPTGNPCDYSCRFPGDDRFLGSRRVILSWPGLTGEPDRTAQHEQFSYWLAGQLGLPFNHRRYVGVSVNGVDRGPMEDTQRPNNDMLRQWFPGRAIEHFSKIQIRYEGNDRATDFEDASAATLERLDDGGDQLRPASYRWNWAPQLDGNTANDLSGIFELVDTVNTEGDDAYTEAVRSLIDIEQWMRTFALEHIVGNWDSYGYGNGQNMYAVKPEGEGWQMMIWDLDIGSGSSSGESATTDLFKTTNPLFPIVDGDRNIVRRMYRHPEFVRHYWRALEDAANGPMIEERVDGIVDPKFEKLREAFGATIRSPSALKSYTRNRRAFILDELSEEVAAEFSVDGVVDGRITTDANPVMLRGTAPVSVRTIRVNGVDETVTWVSPTEWALTYPLLARTTALEISGPTSGDAFSVSLEIEYTGALDPLVADIVINEWMADNQSTLADPADGKFEDWVELYNAGPTPVDLMGYTLTDDLAVPAKWTFPAESRISPGEFLLVWLDGQTDQTSAKFGLHAGFSLSRSGEEIGLYKPDGTRSDAVQFGGQLPDVSFGRTPDGRRTTPKALAIATPGESNSSDGTEPFRIVEAELILPEDVVRLKWTAIPGRTYAIQTSDALAEGAWEAVGDPIVAEGRLATSDIAKVTEGQQFFRIVERSE